MYKRQDLFHVVARKAEAVGRTFYMFGASEDENAAAVENVRKMYPNLKIVGHSHGYLRGEALRAKVEEINCLLYTSPSPRDRTRSRMPSSA